jgi:hypothetical protein
MRVRSDPGLLAMLLRATFLAYGLFKEALHRLVGMDRNASPATTVFVSGMIAGTLASLATPLVRRLRQPLPMPSLGSGLLAFGAARNAAVAVGGEPLRDTPYANAIIVTGFVSPAARIAALPIQMVTAAFVGMRSAWRYLTRPRAPRRAR